MTATDTASFTSAETEHSCPSGAPCVCGLTDAQLADLATTDWAAQQQEPPR